MESSLPFIRSPREETYLEVQWLRLHAFKKKKDFMLNTAGGAGWIRVQGTKILHATQPKKRSHREDLYVALEKG